MVSEMLIGLMFLSGDVVATTAMPRGTILTDDMMSGADASPFLGKALKRPIFAGRTISPADVEEPPLVLRQSAVTVIFRRNGLVLTTSGRALGAGAKGAQININLEGRRRPVSAVVVSKGIVEVQR